MIIPMRPDFLYNLTVRLEHPVATISGGNLFDSFTSGTSGEDIICKIRTKSESESLTAGKIAIKDDALLLTKPEYSIGERDRIYYSTYIYEVTGINPNQFMDVYKTYNLKEIR